jgi:radical SAM superfamily enzyme YgiQ (UPF0313 family)
VLARINKGVTAELEIIAGTRIKSAGIELSVYFMPGIGGKELSRENALETARVVRAVDPDFVRVRTAVVNKGTELWQDYQNGDFKLCGDNEKLREIRLLIEHAENCTGFLGSDHIINLLQDVEGSLADDREKMLSAIDRYFGMTAYEQRLYQLARRAGAVTGPEDMKFLPPDYIENLDRVVRAIKGETLWDGKMNEMMSGYI